MFFFLSSTTSCLMPLTSYWMGFRHGPYVSRYTCVKTDLKKVKIFLVSFSRLLRADLLGNPYNRMDAHPLHLQPTFSCFLYKEEEEEAGERAHPSATCNSPEKFVPCLGSLQSRVSRRDANCFSQHD